MKTYFPETVHVFVCDCREGGWINRLGHYFGVHTNWRWEERKVSAVYVRRNGEWVKVWPDLGVEGRESSE